MDERLEKALDFSNYMITLNNQKRLLREKFEEGLLYFYAGSQFTITKELINFCKAMDDADQDSIVLIDDHGNTALVENIEDFYGKILAQYFETANSYHAGYISLKKNRSVEKLVEYEQE